MQKKIEYLIRFTGHMRRTMCIFTDLPRPYWYVDRTLMVLSEM